MNTYYIYLCSIAYFSSKNKKTYNNIFFFTQTAIGVKNMFKLQGNTLTKWSKVSIYVLLAFIEDWARTVHIVL